jgi:transposase
VGLKSSILPPIPYDTLRAARSVFHTSNSYITVGDRINELLDNIHREKYNRSISRGRGEPLDLSPLISIFQYKERLNDQQAAEAVRFRIDWKYALHLPNLHPGIPPSMLCHFRIQVFTQPETQAFFQAVLDQLQLTGFLEAGIEVQADKVCLANCALNRYARVLESMQTALETLARSDPELLRRIAAPSWYSRYRSLPHTIHSHFDREEPQTAAEAVGKDIERLIDEIETRDPSKLSTIPEVSVLRHVLDDQFKSQGPQKSKRLALKWSLKNCIYVSGDSLLTAHPQELCYGMGIQ